MQLTRGAVTVDLGCASFPISFDLMGKQGEEWTSVRHVEGFSQLRHVNRYKFDRMPKTIFDQLYSFFVAEAQLMLNDFTVIDDLGQTYNGSFAEPSLGGAWVSGTNSEYYFSGTISIYNLDIQP